MSDTLEGLQAALAPKAGMRRIPLTLETYQHQSRPLSSKLLMNQYAEQQPADSRNAVALLPVPGLSTFLAVGTGPIHAINDDLPGAIYVVSGTQFWMMSVIASVWTATFLGDIGTPSGGYTADQRLYSIAVGPTAAVVCVPPNAYASVGGAAVAPITAMPAYGASSVAYLDGYFVFTGQGAPQFFFTSRLLDPFTVDPLDFAALDAFPNAVTKVLALGSDLWFAGASGWEIWYNAGNADFPFRRRQNGMIQRSVGAATSIAKGDESLFWWSADNRIYRTRGYQEERISTHAVETSIFTGILDSFTYNYFGHIFYALNMGDRTLVYDVATKVWHSASSTPDGTGPWRAKCATANTGVPLLGDRAAGRVLVANPNLATDVGVAVQRQVVLPPLYASRTGSVGHRAFCSRLEVEMEVGGADSPGTVVLDWSNDGGITYTGGPRVMSTGSPGETRKRVYATRLGSFRQRVFRLTSQQPMNIYSVDADIAPGAS